MNAIIQALNIEDATFSETAISEIISLLRDVQNQSQGMRIGFEQDFRQLLEVIETNPDRKELSPMFDPRYCDIDATNGFWIKGTNSDGEIVHLQAVRFNDLSGTTLSQHWQANQTLYRPPGVNADFENSAFDNAPASHEITGRVCYHGELWIHKEFRGRHLASRLANLAMLLANVRFNPDFIYCLIAPEVIRTGLSVRHGYLHMHPHGLRWNVSSDEETHNEYLVWMTGQELEQLMMRPQEVC